jgi:hypothetical protein
MIPNRPLESARDVWIFLHQPDGRYVAFFSEHVLFSVDPYVANAATGKSIRRLTKSGTSAHFDAVRSISSPGSWSPDGRRLAYVTFRNGNNQFAILNVQTAKIENRYRLPLKRLDGRSHRRGPTLPSRLQRSMLPVQRGLAAGDLVLAASVLYVPFPPVATVGSWRSLLVFPSSASPVRGRRTQDLRG